MKYTTIFKDFFNGEKTGGIILLCVTFCSILLANSVLGNEYMAFWQSKLLGHSMLEIINDGLLTLFFLLIGLELERELYTGELSNPREAILPIIGAIGGMVVPAILYIFINWGKNTISGAGIPTATDIAFALGVLSLLGSRVPTSLKVFLSALAVLDDLGAIIIISIFYTHSINLYFLMAALSTIGLLILCNYLKLKYLSVYLGLGIVLWYCMYNSGVHATISGVILAFCIPFKIKNSVSSSEKLQKYLNKIVPYFILPLFAMANTAILLNFNEFNLISDTQNLGIAIGLLLGKPLGITLFIGLAVAFGLGKYPQGMNTSNLIGIGFLGGIGFTMSIFISLLAFKDTSMINNAKITIILASTLAGMIGFGILKSSISKKSSDNK